jgi:hypothetical protein
MTILEAKLLPEEPLTLTGQPSPAALLMHAGKLTPDVPNIALAGQPKPQPLPHTPSSLQHLPHLPLSLHVVAEAKQSPPPSSQA